MAKEDMDIFDQLPAEVRRFLNEWPDLNDAAIRKAFLLMKANTPPAQIINLVKSAKTDKESIQSIRGI